MGLESQRLSRDWQALCSARQKKSSIIKGFFDPGFHCLLLIRISFMCKGALFGIFGKVIRLFVLRVFGCEIASQVDLKGGLILPHPLGTVIGASSIGEDCVIMQGVTLGAKTPDFLYTPELRPMLGDRVVVGAGAKILGGITVGNDAVIGANAVVVSDVPEGKTYAGIPAKDIKS